MKKIIAGIFLILSLILLAYVGLTNVTLAKIVDTCCVGVILIAVIFEIFITRGE